MAENLGGEVLDGPAIVAERHNSLEVYAEVMNRALGIMPDNVRSALQQRGVVCEVEPSPLRDTMDLVLGSDPIALRRLPVTAYGHRLWNSDQAQRPSESYKVCGGTYALAAALRANPDLRGVAMASAGNAIGGVAWARPVLEKLCGRSIELVAECTTGASELKLDKLRSCGVTVHNVHKSFSLARKAADLRGKQPGWATLEAYDSYDTMAGQSRIAWEALASLLRQADRGEIDLHETLITIFDPVGGGGKLNATASVVRWAKDQGIVGENVQVMGVQMDGCDAKARYRKYVLAGLQPPADLFAEGLPFNPKADGTAVEEPGELTRAIACDPRFVADILTVSEGELGLAMAALTKCRGRRIEPAGALSLAGAWQHGAMYPSRPRVAPPETLVTFTTGANVSDELYGYFMDKAAETRRERDEASRVYREKMWNLAKTGAALTDRAETVKRAGLRVVHSPARSA